MQRMTHKVQLAETVAAAPKQGTRRPMGRPREAVPARGSAIARDIDRYLAAGGSFERLAELCGVCRKTVARWYAKGEAVMSYMDHRRARAILGAVTPAASSASRSQP